MEEGSQHPSEPPLDGAPRISGEKPNDEEEEESWEELVAQQRHLVGEVDEELAVDPWRIDLYQAAIAAHKASGNREALRRYRRACAQFCPVDEDFWIHWIEDEKQALGSAGTTEGNELVVSLYEEALLAYPSVRIWLHYINLMEHMREALSLPVNKIRNLLERALGELGLHALDGPKLWSSYRAFETILLENAPDEAAQKMHMERIRKLFLRQLKLPLGGLPDLWDEYRFGIVFVIVFGFGMISVFGFGMTDVFGFRMID